MCRTLNQGYRLLGKGWTRSLCAWLLDEVYLIMKVGKGKARSWPKIWEDGCTYILIKTTSVFQSQHCRGWEGTS